MRHMILRGWYSFLTPIHRLIAPKVVATQQPKPKDEQPSWSQPSRHNNGDDAMVLSEEQATNRGRCPPFNK